MRRRIGLILSAVLAIVGLSAIPSATSAAVGCNTWTVTNATWSNKTVTLSVDGVWHYLSPGERSGFRTWDKVRVPAGSDLKVGAGADISQDKIYKVNGAWYEPGAWNCSTQTDAQHGGPYWYTDAENDGYFG